MMIMTMARIYGAMLQVGIFCLGRIAPRTIVNIVVILLCYIFPTVLAAGIVEPMCLEFTT